MPNAAESSSDRHGALTWLAIAAGIAALAGLVYYHFTAHGPGSTHGEPEAPPLWLIGILPTTADSTKSARVLHMRLVLYLRQEKSISASFLACPT